MRVYAPVAGRHSKSPSCAQPCEIPSQCSNTKSQISFSHCRAQAYIYDFVFEHGKGTAIYDVYIIYNLTNNIVPIKHRTQNIHPYSTHHYAFQNLSFHFPYCGDTYIVQYLYSDVAHNRPLPTSALFPIFSFFHQKTPQEFLVMPLLRLPQITLSSQWILHERYNFSYYFIKKLNTFSLKFFPHLDTKKI